MAGDVGDGAVVVGGTTDVVVGGTTDVDVGAELEAVWFWACAEDEGAGPDEHPNARSPAAATVTGMASSRCFFVVLCTVGRMLFVYYRTPLIGCQPSR